MIDPECFKYTYSKDYPNQGIAYTATGYIIPCCWFDTPELLTSKYSYMAKSLSDDTTIEEIINSDDWTAFYNNLKNGIGLPPCQWRCSVTNEIKANERLDL